MLFHSLTLIFNSYGVVLLSKLIVCKYHDEITVLWVINPIFSFCNVQVHFLLTVFLPHICWLYKLRDQVRSTQH